MVTICTASLTFNNSTFCPHSVFMCFVWIWEQTAIISLYSINWLVFFQGKLLYLRIKTLHPPKRRTLPIGRHIVAGLPLSSDTITRVMKFIASSKTTAVGVQILSGRTEHKWGKSREKSLTNGRQCSSVSQGNQQPEFKKLQFTVGKTVDTLRSR